MCAQKVIISKVKQRVALLAVLLFSVLFSETAGAQKVAVRNNLLYDLTLTPNLGVDVKMGDQWSGGLSVGFNPWPTSDDVSKKWRHLLIAPQSFADCSPVALLDKGGLRGSFYLLGT